MDGEEKTLENLSSSDVDGLFFEGVLAEGTYYIHETTAPDGYYALTDDLKLMITETGVSLFRGGTTTEIRADENDVFTVPVENYSGYELPSTGGRGSRGFYLLGAMFLAFSGIGFAVKRRRAE